jgi:hypothetical protein
MPRTTRKLTAASIRRRARGASRRPVTVTAWVDGAASRIDDAILATCGYGVLPIWRTSILNPRLQARIPRHMALLALAWLLDLGQPQDRETDHAASSLILSLRLR